MCVCVCTCVVGRTDAGVVVDAVDAGGVVLAVVVFAVVRVHLAALALEARRTHTAAHTHTRRHKHNARYKAGSDRTLAPLHLKEKSISCSASLALKFLL